MDSTALPAILAPLTALLGLVAVILMGVGDRKKGRVGIYGLGLLLLAMVVMFVMIRLY